MVGLSILGLHKDEGMIVLNVGNDCYYTLGLNY